MGGGNEERGYSYEKLNQGVRERKKMLGYTALEEQPWCKEE
jgi:hypothetical protein